VPQKIRIIFDRTQFTCKRPTNSLRKSRQSKFLISASITASNMHNTKCGYRSIIYRDVYWFFVRRKFNVLPFQSTTPRHISPILEASC